jgi:2-amino-4-hydroxy-6-hydroxymethyldihydropteridine diphosphokinase
VNRLFLGVGGNVPGPWGSPYETQRRAQAELARAGLAIVRASRVYPTAPVGPGLQASYLNSVLLIETDIAPGALLRLLKGIERQAGRRFGRRWGPRSLDIDVLDYGGRRFGWPPGRRERGRLVLPHPELHRRAFVLVPLLEIAPHWRHPALGVSARTLLARLGRGRGSAGARGPLAFAAPACEKSHT